MQRESQSEEPAFDKWLRRLVRLYFFSPAQAFTPGKANPKEWFLFPSAPLGARTAGLEPICRSTPLKGLCEKQNHT
jgi:hypothetical protein